MTTKASALAQGRYYPSFIRLETEISDRVPPLTLAAEFGRSLREAGLGEIVRYKVPNMGTDDAPGAQKDLEAEIQRLGSEEAHAFIMVLKDKTRLVFSRGVGGRPTWSIEGYYPPETVPELTWMEAMAKLALTAARVPGLQHQVLARHETSWAEFPPQPPLARYNHIVTVTDAQVADAYEDPAAFWECWGQVEQVGDFRIGIRALDKLEDDEWLAATFESTMHLARIAKPKQTIYLTPHRGGLAPAVFAPWWEYGDLIAEEKAGYPALSLVGYEPRTRTLEYAGYVTNTPLERGGPDPRNVLIREIHEVRWIVGSQKDRAGNPVDCVRIVFLEEWMARRERRPLLDVGARVFFMDRKTGDLVEITD